MDLIDLRNVSDLTGIDINMVDTNTLAPEMEPNRQLYFMAKSREYVKRKSEELGRNLTVHITTFGFQLFKKTRRCNLFENTRLFRRKEK